MRSLISTNIWNKVFKKNKDIVSRRIADELFLVPVRGNLADMQKIFTLNPVAEYIWQELDNNNLGDICDGVISAFEVEKPRAESDIREFVTELLDADLIRE
ncbi:MAG: hypothetical protein A2Y81_00835 [Nitrospirae bacterium RBG_13_43_8]|nr:MAG: hypothetical protein A2Y81_00835 [Nitrospirae bacterium RBG_13_43_8]